MGSCLAKTLFIITIYTFAIELRYEFLKVHFKNEEKNGEADIDDKFL